MSPRILSLSATDVSCLEVGAIADNVDDSMMALGVIRGLPLAAEPLPKRPTTAMCEDSPGERGDALELSGGA